MLWWRCPGKQGRCGEGRADSHGLARHIQGVLRCPEAVVGSRRCVLRPLLSELKEYRNAIAGVGRHDINNLKRSNFAEFWLPLPPLAEQKRIVAKVEVLLASVNAAREHLARVPAILKRFRQAVLAAACEGRLTRNGERSLSVTCKCLLVNFQRPGNRPSWAVTSPQWRTASTNRRRVLRPGRRAVLADVQHPGRAACLCKPEANAPHEG